MIRLNKPQRVIKPLNIGLLELDVDPLAERYSVIDRNTFSCLKFGLKPASGIVKILLPVKYATGSNLMVCILDDDRAYNAKVADGVKLQLVDMSTVTLG